LLLELEIDAANFHKEKKLEAAERLEQQIALLKVSSANQVLYCCLENKSG